jgi:hypothetical protein
MYRDKRYLWLSWYELRLGDPYKVQAQLFNMIYLDLVLSFAALESEVGGAGRCDSISSEE